MNLAFMAAQGCASERARELGSLEGILSAEAHPALARTKGVWIFPWKQNSSRCTDFPSIATRKYVVFCHGLLHHKHRERKHKPLQSIVKRLKEMRLELRAVRRGKTKTQKLLHTKTKNRAASECAQRESYGELEES